MTTLTPKPFEFRKVFYLVEAIGLRARRLDELLRLVTVAHTDSIGFHMHRAFLAHKFAHAEYPNDFAHWVARLLGDEILGERLANLRVSRHKTMAETKAELAQILAEHLMQHPDAAQEVAPSGRDFNLCGVRKFVLTTGKVAHDLPQLVEAIAEVESSSLFFHLFETRFEDAPKSSRANDFAAWAETTLRNPVLAAKLESFDPYMFSLEQSRKVLLRILSEAQAQMNPTKEAR